MRRRPRPSRRSPHPNPLVIETGDDAAIVARVLASWHPKCLTLVLLDGARCVIDAIPIADTVDVEEIADTVVSVAGRTAAAAVLYVSADPPCGELLAEHDIATWHRVRQRHATAGMPAVDWLLVSGPVVRSMAETTGCAPW